MEKAALEKATQPADEQANAISISAINTVRIFVRMLDANADGWTRATERAQEGRHGVIDSGSVRCCSRRLIHSTARDELVQQLQIPSEISSTCHFEDDMDDMDTNTTTTAPFRSASLTYKRPSKHRLTFVPELARVVELPE